MGRITPYARSQDDKAISPKKLRATDPNIDGILAAILVELGRMEMVDPDTIRAAFNKRTGASV